MTKEELIQEIKDEASRQVCFVDPKTEFVVEAKTAIKVIESLDPEAGREW